jgi:hypothetical protein
LIGEMKLMRRYPHILREWLLKDADFKKNNPNYEAIMEYLKGAKIRKNADAMCATMDHGAWMQAYQGALNGDINQKGDYVRNYLDPGEYGIPMVEHCADKIKVVWSKNYHITDLKCNDYGPYELITKYFLKEKDPRVWKYLLKDDDFGLKNIAMGSALTKGAFNVSLMWYEKISNTNCPTFAHKKYIGLTPDRCLNQYNFRKRRCHKYNKGCGWPTKPGEGETHADKPQPGDDPVPPKPKPEEPVVCNHCDADKPLPPAKPPVKPPVVPVKPTPKPKPAVVREKND